MKSLYFFFWSFSITKIVSNYFRLGLLSVLIIGLFLNLILKDLIWPVSGIFYLLPFRLLLLISITYIIISLKNKAHRITSIISFVLILLILLSSGSGFIENNLPPNLILWNVARDKTTDEDLAEFVMKHQAEVFIFIEFDKKKRSEAKKLDLDKLLPNYRLNRLSGNTAILTKNKLKVTRIDSLNDYYNYFNIVESDGIVYAIVDIGSWPLKNRAKPFEMLYKLVTKYNVDIIAGDFNTPYNSVHFGKFFENYICGNTELKYGRETFPSYIPLVALDHIIISTKFKIKNYMPIKSYGTDHYPLQLNYE